ncbi:adenine-specific DNA-methyltransferase [Capnocytophaga leadbetteri]|uniref:site-specific DNA-methyltransferase (adenine-specific) n=1 Tax=Capnocytophaga leadbetteri TaxID=327575 RepID=A0A2T5XRQ5_9FLAO|nr:site-specific DNA-methyltransferase [Capnocytophaga leadbetteri]PTX00657.1 adenine-specific DNA-methyltransferase [Capnocytophaga leadbetteri]
MEIKKQTLTSASHSEFTLEALKQIAPSAFTEVRGADGELTQKVNFDVLRELLGDAIADADEESFGFQWVGKQAAKRAAAEPTRQTLRPFVEDSVDWDTTENLYIEGDNLEVLKLLQRAYLGKVKMIYIDPPYNTGNDFVYQDDFAMSGEEMDEAMGNLDEEGNRLRRNLDSNPRYHSDWCSMMYSRLLVGRTLLANDGVIFISIDDNEVHHLRKICDEVFGSGNFIGQITWLKKRKGSFLSKGIISLTEYLLVYSKDKVANKGLFGGVPDSNESQPIIKRTNKIGELHFPANVVKTKLKDGLYNAGTYGNDINPVTLLNDINVLNGQIVNEFRLLAPFIWSQSMLDKQISQGSTFVINTINMQVRAYRVYEEDCFKGLGSVINGVEIKGTNEDAYEELERLLQWKRIFDYSKPTNYIKAIVNASTFFDKDSLILDFFSGSATTAHAVMQLNAEDGGKRKYIMVQLPEATPEGSEARKAGYNTICEIGKERIRRAGKKIKETAGNESKDLDTGFRVLRVDSSNMEDAYFEPAGLKQENLFTQVDSVKYDRTELDLLFGCMVDWGVELSYPLRKEEVAGKHLHIVNEGALVACFDREINLEAIRHIAEMKPLRVIFRESCFATDADKLNIYEQFKQLCGWSDDEAYKRIHVI